MSHVSKHLFSQVVLFSTLTNAHCMQCLLLKRASVNTSYLYTIFCQLLHQCKLLSLYRLGVEVCIVERCTLQWVCLVFELEILSCTLCAHAFCTLNHWLNSSYFHICPFRLVFKMASEYLITWHNLCVKMTYTLIVLLSMSTHYMC